MSNSQNTSANNIGEFVTIPKTDFHNAKVEAKKGGLALISGLQAMTHDAVGVVSADTPSFSSAPVQRMQNDGEWSGFALIRVDGSTVRNTGGVFHRNDTPTDNDSGHFGFRRTLP